MIINWSLTLFMVIFTDIALGYETDTQCWRHKTDRVIREWTVVNTTDTNISLTQHASKHSDIWISRLNPISAYCVFTSPVAIITLRLILLVMVPASFKQMQKCFHRVWVEGVWMGSCLFNVCVWCLSVRCIQAGHIKRLFRLVQAVTECDPLQLSKNDCFNPLFYTIQYYCIEVAVGRGCILGTSTLTWATMDKPGREWAEEKRLVGYEPEWCFVIGLQCWSLIGPNEHHV